MKRARVDLKMAAMDADASIDVSLFGNGAVSRKTMHKVGERTYSVLHEIDDTETFFTYKSAREVIAGKRSPWDGDITEREWLEQQ